MELVQCNDFDGDGFRPVSIADGWLVAMKNHSDAFLRENIRILDWHSDQDEAFVLLKGSGTLLYAEINMLERAQQIEMCFEKVYTVRKRVYHAVATTPGTKLLVIRMMSYTDSDIYHAPLAMLHVSDRSEFLPVGCEPDQLRDEDIPQLRQTVFSYMDMPDAWTAEKRVEGTLSRRIVSYVQRYHTQPITIEVLARQLYVSKSYLCRVFKRDTGVTIHTYLTRCRIDTAKRLLAEMNSVTEACEKSGFGDYSNFIRTFSKYMGVTPLAYKRSKEKNKA